VVNCAPDAGRPVSAPMARWQSGDAAACKAVYTGSIPVLASIGGYAALFVLLISSAALAQPPGGRAESPAASPIPETVNQQSYPPDLVRAGSTLFGAQCGFCHGRDAAGGAGGSDLTRSQLVAEDLRGDKIGPVVRNGRANTTMPAFADLSDSDLSAIVAYIHDQKDQAGSVEGGRRSVALADLQTGDATAGRRYFESACSECHSVAGDLAGIASRMEGLRLLQQMLYPRARGFGDDGIRARPRVTVTTAEGETLRGPLVYEDEFTIALTDTDGRYRSFATSRVDFIVENPLDGHLELLGRYSDQNVHDLLAYLHTLR
jgi:cytochrome c oxidase cbb3-type subunit 3